MQIWEQYEKCVQTREICNSFLTIKEAYEARDTSVFLIR